MVRSGGVLDVYAALTAGSYELEIPDDIFGLGKLPTYVLEIVLSGLNYHQLTDEQKELLLDYLCLREDTMTLTANAGYTIEQSLPAVLTMQLLEIPFDQALRLISHYRDASIAYGEVRYFVDLQYRHHEFRGPEPQDVERLVEYLVEGYPAENIAYAVLAANALKVDINEVIQKHRPLHTVPAYSSISQTPGLFPLPSIPTNDEWLEKLTKEYRLDADWLDGYMTHNGLTSEEIFNLLLGYQYTFKLLLDEETIILLSTTETNPEIPSAAFTYSDTSNFHVNENTGGLIYDEHLITLPGKAGLDLELWLRYDSEKASQLDNVYIETTLEYSKYKYKTKKRNEPAFNAFTVFGRGWE
jgi:hypothetical protein